MVQGRGLQPMMLATERLEVGGLVAPAVDLGNDVVGVDLEPALGVHDLIGAGSRARDVARVQGMAHRSAPKMNSPDVRTPLSGDSCRPIAAAVAPGVASLLKPPIVSMIKARSRTRASDSHSSRLSMHRGES